MPPSHHLWDDESPVFYGVFLCFQVKVLYSVKIGIVVLLCLPLEGSGDILFFPLCLSVHTPNWTLVGYLNFLKNHLRNKPRLHIKEDNKLKMRSIL